MTKQDQSLGNSERFIFSKRIRQLKEQMLEEYMQHKKQIETNSHIGDICFHIGHRAQGTGRATKFAGEP